MSNYNKSDSYLTSKAGGHKNPNSDPLSTDSKNPPGTRARSGSTKDTGTNDDETIFFDTITMTKFNRFQAAIFPIVDKIVHLEKHKDHPFTLLWQEYTKHTTAPGHTFTSESTFRTIQKILPVENLQDYRKHLLECPTLTEYVVFQESKSSKAGFDVHFRDDKISKLMMHELDSKTNGDEMGEFSSFDMLIEPAADHSKTDSEDTEDQEQFIECFGTKTDFPPLWTQVSFILNTHLMDYPTDSLTLKWKQWQKNGVTLRSTFQQVKQMTTITSLTELYFFLRDCQPIQEFLEVKWNDRILYRHRTPKETLSTPLQLHQDFESEPECNPTVVSPVNPPSNDRVETVNTAEDNNEKDKKDDDNPTVPTQKLTMILRRLPLSICLLTLTTPHLWTNWIISLSMKTKS